MLAKVEAVACPGIKVSLHVDAAAHTLLGADRPVLLKGPLAIDGRLVVAGGDKDIICAAVGLERALALGAAAGVVGAVRFNDVVFNKRVASPAVDSEVAVTLGVEGATVVDGAEEISKVACFDKCSSWYSPACSWVPALATDKVASVAPGHRVLAALTHGVHGRAATIRPPGVEVSVVGAFAVGGVLALLQCCGSVAIVTLVEEVKGSSEDAGCSSSGQEE